MEAGRSQPPQPPIVTFTALLVVKSDPSLILATAMIFWDSASRIRTLASATPLSGEEVKGDDATARIAVRHDQHVADI